MRLFKKTRLSKWQLWDLSPFGSTALEVHASDMMQEGDAHSPTARGFEPLRAEPNGFRVHHLNHSVTLSCRGCLQFCIVKINAFHMLRTKTNWEIEGWGGGSEAHLFTHELFLSWMSPRHTDDSEGI